VASNDWIVASSGTYSTFSSPDHSHIKLKVGNDFAIPEHTISVALNYFDRCIVENKGATLDLHLLAVTCLTVASKFFSRVPMTIVSV
jgi:hypothetical protein